MDVKNQAVSSRSSGIMKTKARLLGMQAYSWRQYKVGLCMSDMLLKAVFWDLDGTLIDSEPYWHEGEMEIAAAHGGYWDEDLAWSCSGTPLDHCAKTMIEQDEWRTGRAGVAGRCRDSLRAGHDIAAQARSERD